MNFINRSSATELYDLAKKIGLENLIIIRKKEFNGVKDRYENIIINLDDTGAGSHWVAVNTKKKIYFDSYNQVAPRVISNEYKRLTHNFELQAIDAEMCGQLSILSLYYASKKKSKDFYKLFKDVY